MLRSRDLDGLLPSKSISIQNSCRNRTANNEPWIRKGFGYRPDDNEQGKFKVEPLGLPITLNCKWCIAMGNYIRS